MEAGPRGDEGAAAGRCPDCGRFVGPYDACPHCGAEMGRRLAVRALRWGSVALALLGLVILFGVAARTAVPLTPVARLGPDLNWSYVQIEGVVSREPAHDAETGACKFWVRDATGEVLVTA